MTGYAENMVKREVSVIYVLAGSHSQFHNFMREFQLRQHFGDSGNREGQVVNLHEPQQLYGTDSALVLAWGTWRKCPYAEEIQVLCAQKCIPFLEVPDLKRARAQKEHPEIFKW